MDKVDTRRVSPLPLNGKVRGSSLGGFVVLDSLHAVRRDYQGREGAINLRTWEDVLLFLLVLVGEQDRFVCPGQVGGGIEVNNANVEHSGAVRGPEVEAIRVSF